METDYLLQQTSCANLSCAAAAVYTEYVPLPRNPVPALGISNRAGINAIVQKVNFIIYCVRSMAIVKDTANAGIRHGNRGGLVGFVTRVMNSRFAGTRFSGPSRTFSASGYFRKCWGHVWDVRYKSQVESPLSNMGKEERPAEMERSRRVGGSRSSTSLLVGAIAARGMV